MVQKRTLYVLAGVCVVFVIAASGALPDWMINVEGKSVLESAFFRLMAMPGGAVLGRRPPAETRPALSELIKSKSSDAELYSLRALEDEQALDFDAAEADWKQYAQKAQDKGAGQLALADFYHRRARPADEIKALAAAGQMPAIASESLTPIAEQRSWKAYERLFQVISAQAMPKDVSIAQYKAWIARYPQERALHVRYFQFLLEQKDAATAQQAIADYQKAFPSDAVFPVRAKALLNYKQGSVEQGLAVYDQAFQPLWPPELVKSFFDLLKETRSTRKYADQWRAQLDANPDDLNALARLFFYYQQQGKVDVAQQTVTEYRLRKEDRKAQWSADELYTLARLLEQVHAYPEASRYYYALFNAQGPDAQEKALAGLTSILLTAPEQPLRLGAGELSIYQDIATLDQGPGFLNGMLSLILNTTAPAMRYSQEEQRAGPYFHRAKAAELLVMFDSRFPNSSQRAELHAQLIETYANYAADKAVLRDGKDFLSAFADAPQRAEVALLMADAYERTNQQKEEFAIYDSLLQELAKRAGQVPLGGDLSTGADTAESSQYGVDTGDADAACDDCGETAAVSTQVQKKAPSKAFSVDQQSTSASVGPRSPEYSRVLGRYLARLVVEKRIPEALVVLRREIDRNPNDPGLYEWLARFLQQNQLGEQTEQVYKRAIQQFQDRSWYHKLARWYLGQKRDSEYEKLTEEVVRIFSGTELQSYFDSVVGARAAIGPVVYVRLNQYAHQRFPHNLTFVRNLLAAYRIPPTTDREARNQLLREHWTEADDVRNEFFQELSGPKLQAQLAQLRNELDSSRWDDSAAKNPVATRFVSEAELWQSHFEDAAAPLGALAHVFPADAEIGERSSAVYRSLAYFDPRNTDLAVSIEQNLLKANPGNRDRLARIGDIYADRELFDKAAPYWNRMPEIEPGNASSYLEAATIYWDYFDFDNALRLLNDGRSKLARPGLYTYEEGAIYEGKRDYEKAIAEYAKGALAQEGYSQQRGRLIQLGTRPKYRDLVEQVTLKPVEVPNPPIEALNLRMSVLETQGRKDDLEKLLLGVVERSTSLELVESLESLAQQKSLESVRQRALERQAELTTDPIRRLELRYQLVRFYEAKKDVAAAQRNVEALYQEHPKVLGVVRATVDFYWRTKQQQRAIDVLMAAAKIAYPELAKTFRFEAARKMTDAGQYEQARQIIVPLMNADQYNGEYVTAMASTFARAGDDRGLRDFYLEKIRIFKNAPLDPATRSSKVLELRRGLIPALTRTKDYAGGVDQYIEILNSWPDDQGLTTEGAFYADRYSLRSRLLDFYSRTVTASPRDPRWAVVLARLQTDFEDYPAAIDAYTRAINIRPDRNDLRTARAGLLERLMRFDEAAADYEKIYNLQYKDPAWMEKVAEIRARQGRIDPTIAALRLALIEGRPQSAANLFEVARRLEKWNMLPQALEFAEQGMKMAGDDVLADSASESGAELWARLLTGQRKYQEAWDRLGVIVRSVSARADSVLSKPAVANSDDDAYRRATETARRNTARAAMGACLREVGRTIDKYYTPEDRARFQMYAVRKREGMPLPDVRDFLLPEVQAAGVPYLEVQLREELLRAFPDTGFSQVPRITELESKRLRFKELGAAMENDAQRVPVASQPQYLMEAAKSYRTGEDWAAELRVLGSLHRRHALGGDMMQRYYQLLLAHEPQTLVELAATATNNTERDNIANYVMEHGDSHIVQLVLGARGRGLAPVWTRSYLALAGLYLRDGSPNVTNAFDSALRANTTIGQQLGHTVDRTNQLAGDIWFYYGGRYGEYLGSVAKKDSADDFLPAALERTPGRSDVYEQLAKYYEDSGDPAKSIADYRHALELSPERADLYDALAVLYWKQNDRGDARASWRQALAIMLRQVKRRAVPETFWRDFGNVMEHFRSRKIFAEFRPEIDAVLREYMRKNGNYRNTALMRDAFIALGDKAAGVAWLLDLASVAPYPRGVVDEFTASRWIPEKYKEPIFRRLLQFAEADVAKSTGMANDYAIQSYHATQDSWISYLLDQKQYDRARAEFDALAADVQRTDQFVALRLRLDAAQNRLDPTLDGYRRDPEHAPSLDVLRQVATGLQAQKDKASARKILEYVFSREIEEHRLTAANLLGLAEIRVDSGDMKGALDLLHRVTLVVGQPFENLDAAASLLLKTGYPAEATEFLDQLVKAQPWNTSARLKLAQAQLKAGKDVATAKAELLAVARGAEVPYDVRVDAATAAAPSAERNWGSNELRLIASGAPVAATEVAAFDYQARLKSAKSAPSNEIRLKLLRAAIEDFPDRVAARIPMFRALLAEHQDQLAIAALEPISSNVYSVLSQKQPETTDEYDSEPSDDEGNWITWRVSQIPAAERPSISAEIAGAMERLDRLQDATRFYKAAMFAESAPAKKEALKKEAAEVQATLTRRRLNAARRPLIHPDLEQGQLVRPMLVSRSAPPGTTAQTRRTP